MKYHWSAFGYHTVLRTEQKWNTFELVDDKAKNNEANFQNLLSELFKKRIIDLIEDFMASKSLLFTFKLFKV